MKYAILLLVTSMTFFSCKKENPEPTTEPSTPAVADTTTFEIDLNLIGSIDFSHDNSNLLVTLSEVGTSLESEQTLSGSDIGVVGQNFFSERMKVDKLYNVVVKDLDDSSYYIWQGDTIYTYSTLISTTIQITSQNSGHYYSDGYHQEGWVSEINFAGQTDQSGVPTAGPFRIQLKI